MDDYKKIVDDYFSEREQKLKEYAEAYSEFQKEMYRIGLQLGMEIRERYQKDPAFRSAVDSLNKCEDI